MARPQVTLLTVFADLPDPRMDRTKLHALSDVILIAVCAVIGGADGWEEIAQFGRCKIAWLRRFLKLPNGTPSPDTFARVFALLDPTEFQKRFALWLVELGETSGLRHIAIDGKAVRGAKRATASGCLHVVSAWATRQRLILGQTTVADGSNETAALPELLRLLDLKGALVTLDAAGCQQEIAGQIRAQGGDYVLAVKQNQPKLHAALAALFAPDLANEAVAGRQKHAAVDDAHGRHEERYVTVAKAPQDLPPGWTDAKAALLVVRERWVDGRWESSHVHYYLTSRRGNAAELAQVVRDHWQIENGLHWTLDVVFAEDQNRTREKNAGANLAWIRRVALSLFKQAPAGKTRSLKGKRRQATWSDDYLLEVLQGNPEIP